MIKGEPGERVGYVTSLPLRTTEMDSTTTRERLAGTLTADVDWLGSRDGRTWVVWLSASSLPSSAYVGPLCEVISSHRACTPLFLFPPCHPSNVNTQKEKLYYSPTKPSPWHHEKQKRPQEINKGKAASFDEDQQLAAKVRLGFPERAKGPKADGANLSGARPQRIHRGETLIHRTEKTGLSRPNENGRETGPGSSTEQMTTLPSLKRGRNKTLQGLGTESMK